MLLVMAAIGGTDILFALDSIPAIFGLTENIFVVFTATAFSLMGLRQLYFLIDGLLDRLIYLSYGLAAILGFIGVKLVLHALHENNAQNAVSAARRHAQEYLDPETDPARRDEVFSCLQAEEAQLRTLPEKYRARIREEDKLMDLLARAHAEHDATLVDDGPRSRRV